MTPSAPRKPNSLTELDAIDRRILAALQQNSLVANQDLAALVGLSPPACLKRVRRLRAANVIQRTVAVLSPDMMGYPLLTIIRVKLELPIVEAARSLEAAMGANPRVMQCMMVAGDFDYLMLVRSRNVGHYQEFARGVIAVAPGIRSYTSEIVLAVTKVTTALPIDDA